MAGLVCDAAQLDEAPIRPALCRKNAVPLACVRVSFSINLDLHQRELYQSQHAFLKVPDMSD